MNVLRGVCCWLSVFGVVFAAVSLAGCSKESPTNSARADEKTSGGQKSDPGTNASILSVGQSGNTPAGAGKGPAKAKSAAKAKGADADPPTIDKNDSGSGLKRKLRGPKLGSGR